MSNCMYSHCAQMFGLSASAALSLLQKWITKFSTLQTQEGEKANQIWIYVYCQTN